MHIMTIHGTYMYVPKELLQNYKGRNEDVGAFKILVIPLFFSNDKTTQTRSLPNGKHKNEMKDLWSLQKSNII